MHDWIVRYQPNGRGGVIDTVVSAVNRQNALTIAQNLYGKDNILGQPKPKPKAKKDDR